MTLFSFHFVGAIGRISSTCCHACCVASRWSNGVFLLANTGEWKEAARFESKFKMENEEPRGRFSPKT